MTKQQIVKYLKALEAINKILDRQSLEEWS